MRVFLRKFDGDIDFVRIKERLELRRVELERVNSYKLTKSLL